MFGLAWNVLEHWTGLFDKRQIFTTPNPTLLYLSYEPTCNLTWMAVCAIWFIQINDTLLKYNVFQSEALRLKLMFNNGRDKAELFVINWTNNPNVINYIILYIKKERFILLHQISKVVTLSYYLIFLGILKSILCFFPTIGCKTAYSSETADFFQLSIIVISFSIT